jgi:hypothetical protein
MRRSVTLLWRVPDRPSGRQSSVTALGWAEVADEHRKVGFDPGDVGPKACLT